MRILNLQAKCMHDKKEVPYKTDLERTTSLVHVLYI